MKATGAEILAFWRDWPPGDDGYYDDGPDIRVFDDPLIPLGWFDDVRDQWRAVEDDGHWVREVLLDDVPKARDVGALSADELVVACRNIGHDLTCPGCAEIFYTGATLGGHTCARAAAAEVAHAVGEQLPPFVRRMALDFDGVVHQHVSKWTGPLDIHDPPVPGAFAFIRDLLARDWVVFIHTTRLCYGIDRELSTLPQLEVAPRLEALLAWFEAQGFTDIRELVAAKKIVPWTGTGKPPAYFYLDDHAVRFEGTFPSYEALMELRWSWHKRPHVTQTAPGLLAAKINPQESP
jgi:hypothetical protein